MGLLNAMFGRRDEVWEARNTLGYFRGVIVKCKKCGYAHKVRQEQGWPPCPECGNKVYDILDAGRIRRDPMPEQPKEYEEEEW